MITINGQCLEFSLSVFLRIFLGVNYFWSYCIAICVIMRPSCRPHYATCLSVCPIQARNSTTEKHRKIKIGTDVTVRVKTFKIWRYVYLPVDQARRQVKTTGLPHF